MVEMISPPRMYMEGSETKMMEARQALIQMVLGEEALGRLRKKIESSVMGAHGQRWCTISGLVNCVFGTRDITRTEDCLDAFAAKFGLGHEAFSRLFLLDAFEEALKHLVPEEFYRAEIKTFSSDYDVGCCLTWNTDGSPIKS